MMTTELLDDDTLESWGDELINQEKALSAINRLLIDYGVMRNRIARLETALRWIKERAEHLHDLDIADKAHEALGEGSGGRDAAS
jgi:hypothetical protein